MMQKSPVKYSSDRIKYWKPTYRLSFISFSFSFCFVLFCFLFLFFGPFSFFITLVVLLRQKSCILVKVYTNLYVKSYKTDPRIIFKEVNDFSRPFIVRITTLTGN